MNGLVTVAVAGQAVAYVLSVILAREIGVSGFEAYVVASAVFIVLATLAPRGSEKYVLRRLPALLSVADWSQALGLMRFGARRTLATALATGIVVAAWTWWLRGPPDETWKAIIVTCLSLPAGALAHYGVEVLSAAGRPFQALATFKLITPLLALSLVLCLMLLPVPLTGPAAVGCWGLAWVAALTGMVVALRRAVPREVFAALPSGDASVWRREARPFFIYRVAMALLGQAGVIALELLQATAAAVGAYAAAMGTVGVAAVLATSTNRAYGRRLALLIEHGDFESLLAQRRARLRWLAPSMALFLVAAFAFSREILSVFQPAFAAEGVTALRILAAATVVTVLFSLAPTYLKFQQRNRTLYTVVVVAAACQLVLLLVLVPPLGATGAALAYALCISGMYGVLALLARREVTALSRS